MKPKKVTRKEKGTLSRLMSSGSPPPLFEEGDGPFWSDPYISKQILQAHLDPETDAASRRPERIDASISFIQGKLGSKAKLRILDLGCGPGLYAERLARLGHEVVGVDLSNLSLNYARKNAKRQGLDIRYMRQDYRELKVPGRFDLVMMVYGEMGTLSSEDRDRLLGWVHDKLVPGGHFVFDVMTSYQRPCMLMRNNWYVLERGFWRPSPHVVMESVFDYEEEGVVLERYHVMETDGQVSDYRVWTQFYTVERISKVLERQGLTMTGHWADLQGTPYHEEAPWLGVFSTRSIERSRRCHR